MSSSTGRETRPRPPSRPGATCCSASRIRASAWATRSGRICSSRSSRPSRGVRAPGSASRPCTASCARAGATCPGTPTKRSRSTACSTQGPPSSRSPSRPTGWRARYAKCWTSPADGVTRRQADLALLLATFLWGTSFVAVKSALAHATPFAFLTVRFGVAALLLAPGTPFSPRPTGRELRGGLLLGALVAFGFITQTAGLVITPPSRSAFIVAVSSVLAPVIPLVVLGPRPSWLTAAALLLATLGIYLLTAPDAGGLNRGDVLTLGCAAAFGGQIVGVTELARDYEARRLVC